MRRKQFLIIGLGRFGSGFANTLYDLGQEVVAMDSNEEPVQQNMNRVTHAMVADATDEATLRDSGVELAYSLASPKLLAQIDLTDDISAIEFEASDGLNGWLEGLGFA